MTAEEAPTMTFVSVICEMAVKSRGECGGESVDNGSNTDSDSEEETLEQLENKT